MRPGWGPLRTPADSHEWLCVPIRQLGLRARVLDARTGSAPLPTRPPRVWFPGDGPPGGEGVALSGCDPHMLFGVCPASGGFPAVSP